MCRRVWRWSQVMFLHSLFSSMAMGTRGVREQCPAPQTWKFVQLFALRMGVTTVNSVPSLQNSEKQVSKNRWWSPVVGASVAEPCPNAGFCPVSVQMSSWEAPLSTLALHITHHHLTPLGSWSWFPYEILRYGRENWHPCLFSVSVMLLVKCSDNAAACIVFEPCALKILV